MKLNQMNLDIKTYVFKRICFMSLLHDDNIAIPSIIRRLILFNGKNVSLSLIYLFKNYNCIYYIKTTK